MKEKKDKIADPLEDKISEEKVALGAQLKSIREGQKMTQEELAYKAGTSQQTVSKCEYGENNSLSTNMRLFDKMGYRLEPVKKTYETFSEHMVSSDVNTVTDKDIICSVAPCEVKKQSELIISLDRYIPGDSGQVLGKKKNSNDSTDKAEIDADKWSLVKLLLLGIAVGLLGIFKGLTESTAPNLFVVLCLLCLEVLGVVTIFEQKEARRLEETLNGSIKAYNSVL